MNRLSGRIAFGVGLTALISGAPAWADDSVAERLAALEQEIAALKQQLHAQQEEQKQQQAEELAAREEEEQIRLLAEKANAKKPKFEMGKDGLKVTSAVGNYSLRLRGYMQADSRTFISDDEDLGVDNLLIRRARPILEGTAGKFGFRIMPDFAGGSTQLVDGYAEYKATDRFNLRLGKFKPPVSLDRLRSATDLTFVERSMPTNLAPNRDTGLMAYGSILPGFTWEAGIFNGVEDLGNTNSDTDDKKEFAARLFAHPFRMSDSALSGLGIGLAGSWGKKEGDLVNRQVGDYRTPGQARDFRYRATTFADGDHWRIAPQGYFYLGPFGLQAEYTVSNQEVRNGAAQKQIENTAWEVQARYVLTGEAVSDRGWPVPANPFDPWSGTWGAWAIAARYGALSIDDDAFPIFADAAHSVSQADSFGLALHGYLSESVRFIVDYEHTKFDAGAAGGQDRETEQVVMTRLDYKF